MRGFLIACSARKLLSISNSQTPLSVSLPNLSSLSLSINRMRSTVCYMLITGKSPVICTYDSFRLQLVNGCEISTKHWPLTFRRLFSSVQPPLIYATCGYYNCKAKSGCFESMREELPGEAGDWNWRLRSGGGADTEVGSG